MIERDLGDIAAGIHSCMNAYVCICEWLNFASVSMSHEERRDGDVHEHISMQDKGLSF